MLNIYVYDILTWLSELGDTISGLFGGKKDDKKDDATGEDTTEEVSNRYIVKVEDKENLRISVCETYF